MCRNRPNPTSELYTLQEPPILHYNDISSQKFLERHWPIGPIVIRGVTKQGNWGPGYRGTVIKRSHWRIARLGRQSHPDWQSISTFGKESLRTEIWKLKVRPTAKLLRNNDQLGASGLASSRKFRQIVPRARNRLERNAMNGIAPDVGDFF